MLSLAAETLCGLIWPLQVRYTFVFELYAQDMPLLYSLVSHFVCDLRLKFRQFPHTYIPVVPASIIECVEAPTPFVMGVHSSCRDNVRFQCS